MLKAFTPVAVLIFSIFLGLEKLSYTETILILMICIGVATTSIGELQFSTIGFIFQIFGILAESSRLVLTNYILKEYKLDSLSSLYYIAPSSWIFLIFSFFIFEYNIFPFQQLYNLSFLSLLLLNGLVAFTLNIAVVMLINHTSALVLTLSGIIKDILLVILSVLYLGSPVTLMQYCGYGFTLFGLNLHTSWTISSLDEAALISFSTFTNWASSRLRLSEAAKQE